MKYELAIKLHIKDLTSSDKSSLFNPSFPASIASLCCFTDIRHLTNFKYPNADKPDTDSIFLKYSIAE